MSTKTPRDKIHGLIKQNYNENTARCVVALVMPVFDALLEEARQQGREEMREKCLKLFPQDCTAMKIFNVAVAKQIKSL